MELIEKEKKGKNKQGEEKTVKKYYPEGETKIREREGNNQREEREEKTTKKTMKGGKGREGMKKSNER